MVTGRVVNGTVVLDQAEALREGAAVVVRPVRRRRAASTPAEPPEPWRTLLRHAGKGKGLPPDLAANHDHYIHGRKKK